MCRVTKLVQVDGEEQWYVSYIGSSREFGLSHLQKAKEGIDLSWELQDQVHCPPLPPCAAVSIPQL